MTRDADPLGQTGTERLRFDRYVLDLGRGSLLLDSTEIPLRPKTFAVLRHLVENSGRLVSKDELFAAVWPHLTVTDDALVQSIGEIRRALGDDGPGLITTIPRRGYRFDSAVEVLASADPLATNATLASAAFPESAPASEPSIRAQASTLLAMALSDRRGRLYAALALVCLLTAAALWTAIGSLRTGDQLMGHSEVGTKAAVAVLPFLNQSDDPARDYFADGVT